MSGSDSGSNSRFSHDSNSISRLESKTSRDTTRQSNGQDIISKRHKHTHVKSATASSINVSNLPIWASAEPIVANVFGFLKWSRIQQIKSVKEAQHDMNGYWNVFEHWPWMTCKQWYVMARDKTRILYWLLCEMRPIWHGKQLAVSYSQLVIHTGIIAKFNHYLHSVLHQCTPVMNAYLFRLTNTSACQEHFRSKLQNTKCTVNPLLHDMRLVAVYPVECPICQLPFKRRLEIADEAHAAQSKPKPVILHCVLNKLPMSIRVFMIGPPDTRYAGGLYVAEMHLGE